MQVFRWAGNDILFSVALKNWSEAFWLSKSVIMTSFFTSHTEWVSNLQAGMVALQNQIPYHLYLLRNEHIHVIFTKTFPISWFCAREEAV